MWMFETRLYSRTEIYSDFLPVLSSTNYYNDAKMVYILQARAAYVPKVHPSRICGRTLSLITRKKWQQKLQQMSVLRWMLYAIQNRMRTEKSNSQFLNLKFEPENKIKIVNINEYMCLVLYSLCFMPFYWRPSAVLHEPTVAVGMKKLREHWHIVFPVTVGKFILESTRKKGHRLQYFYRQS